MRPWIGRPATPTHHRLADERSVWERRRLGLQWNLDESELRFGGNLPGAEGKILEAGSPIESGPITCQSGDRTVRRLSDPTRRRSGRTRGHQYQRDGGDRKVRTVMLTVNADLEALTSETSGVAELAAGPVLANQTARRLACDAIVEAAVYDDHRMVGVGRKTRTIPGWLRRQLWARDGGCQFPGCPHLRFVHGHHIQHWADGGPTNLDQSHPALRIPPPVPPRTRVEHRMGP